MILKFFDIGSQLNKYKKTSIALMSFLLTKIDAIIYKSALNLK